MRRGIDVVAGGCDFATWVRPGSGIDQGQHVRDQKSKHEPYGLREIAKGTCRKEKKERNRKEENREEEKGKKRKKDYTRGQQRRSGMVAVRKAGILFSCLEMFLAISPQPLVHEAGERDHVGPYVLKSPISVCTPEDHDEVERRSSSTTDEIWCHS